MTFIKHDQDKPKLLAFVRIGVAWFRNKLSAWPLEEVGRVLDFGAEKYAPGNWALCNDPARYYEAALRHIGARSTGEELDPESNIDHLAHAMCCLLFAREIEEANKCTQQK